MNAITAFWRDLTLKPQGFTMVVAAFLPVFAIIAMFPIVGLIIDHFKDVPDAAQRVPQMVTAPGYAIALLAPFAGFFVDKLGRRKLLLFCTFFYGIAGVSPFFMDSLDAVYRSRLLLGVCEAGILTIINTLIADYWDDTGRRNWLMLQGLVGPFFQPGVFFLVSVLAAAQWNSGFLVYLIAFPVFLAMYFFVFEPKKPEAAQAATAEPIAAGPFPMKEALMVGALTLFASVLYYVFIVNGSLAWREIGVTDPIQISKLTTIPAWCIMLGALVFRWCSRYSNATQLGVMFALLGLGLAGIGLSRAPIEMQAGLILQQTGAGMAVPALIAWAQTKFGFEHRGRGMGIWSSAFFLGQAISPIIVGKVAAQGGSMKAAFIAAGLGALVAMVGAFLVGRRGKASKTAQHML